MTEETKMEALDELFKEWLNVRFPEELGFKLSKNLTYDKFNDETKAEFGAWLLDRYSSKPGKKESARIKARAILEGLRFFRVGDLQMSDNAANELVDRVAVHINFCTNPKDAVFLVLRDWCEDKIFNHEVSTWIKYWVYNRLVELKSKEK